MTLQIIEDPDPVSAHWVASLCSAKLRMWWHNIALVFGSQDLEGVAIHCSGISLEHGLALALKISPMAFWPWHKHCELQVMHELGEGVTWNTEIEKWQWLLSFGILWSGCYRAVWRLYLPTQSIVDRWVPDGSGRRLISREAAATG